MGKCGGMRNISFIVSGQKLRKDPKCDFDGIVAGTRNYLVADFSFDGQWSGMSKVAVFKCLSQKFPSKIQDNKCHIPQEALVWSNFSLYIVGQNNDGVRIQTNDVMVKQEVV